VNLFRISNFEFQIIESTWLHLSRPSLGLLLLLVLRFPVGYTASLTVAPANSAAEAKARADFVCHGAHDEIELAQSLNQGVDSRSVEWLPGDYYLDATLVIPASHDNTIRAEGTCLHYRAATGDAVLIKGMLSTRIYLGTIETASDGVALHFQNEQGVNTLMSIFRFTALVGNGRGTGLFIDTHKEGISTDRFDGAEICGFETGMLLPDTPDQKETHPKLDTDWFWINSIHDCATGVREGNIRVDDTVLRTAIDTSLPGSVGLRTKGQYGRYDVVWSNTGGSDTTALLLDPGAWHNVLEFRPLLPSQRWRDNSRTTNNLLISVMGAPWRSTAVSATASDPKRADETR
jgi:hypothetical protein